MIMERMIISSPRFGGKLTHEDVARLALFAIDTGVAKRVDPAQLAWLKAAPASASAKGKSARSEDLVEWSAPLSPDAGLRK
jgi:hypothetical protein